MTHFPDCDDRRGALLLCADARERPRSSDITRPLTSPLSCSGWSWRARASGGTRAGAIENLRHRWVPLHVRAGDDVPAGTRR